jgi:hypothetical protein
MTGSKFHVFKKNLFWCHINDNRMDIHTHKDHKVMLRRAWFVKNIVSDNRLN